MRVCNNAQFFKRIQGKFRFGESGWGPAASSLYSRICRRQPTCLELRSPAPSSLVFQDYSSQASPKPRYLAQLPIACIAGLFVALSPAPSRSVFERQAFIACFPCSTAMQTTLSGVHAQVSLFCLQLLQMTRKLEFNKKMVFVQIPDLLLAPIAVPGSQDVFFCPRVWLRPKLSVLCSSVAGGDAAVAMWQSLDTHSDVA